MEEKSKIPMIHNLELKSRKACNLTGVTDVISFDEKEILLDTSMGMLQIRGSDLHVRQVSLESGKVEIEGTCSSIVYQGESTGRKPGDSVLKRLFR
ncbi:MAG: sporulation protein YabP [Lachnospiraceae bacterium]